MSHLDDELRSALSESEAQAGSEAQVGTEAQAGSEAQSGMVQDVVQGAGRPTADKSRGNLGLLIGVLAAVAAILTLVFSSVEEAAIYSVTTDKLLANKSDFMGKNVRVEGELVPGTLTRREQPCEYRFWIQKNGQKVAVRFPQCVVPDTFKDVPGMAVQVTAEGKLSPEGHFDATHIMAKCPSKYEMQQRSKNGEAAPHAVMGIN